MRNEILPLFVVPIFLCMFGLFISISMDLQTTYNDFDKKVLFDNHLAEKWVDTIQKR